MCNEQLCSDLCRFVCVSVTSRYHAGVQTVSKHCCPDSAWWQLPPPRCRHFSTVERACVSEAVLRWRPFGRSSAIMSELCAGIRETRILFFDRGEKPALVTRADHVTLCVSSCASGLMQPDHSCLFRRLPENLVVEFSGTDFMRLFGIISKFQRRRQRTSFITEHEIFVCLCNTSYCGTSKCRRLV